MKWTERARAFNRREGGLLPVLLADLVLFLALLTAYLVARAGVAVWPRPFHFPSGLMTITMIMFLGAASFVMHIAERSARHRDDAMAQRMIVMALVGWGTYLFLLALEWGRLYLSEEVMLLDNRWKVPALGLSYYGFTGFHAAHVLVGSVWLIAASTHLRRWRLRSLMLYVDFVNAMFVVIAFIVVLSAADLNGF